MMLDASPFLFSDEPWSIASLCSPRGSFVGIIAILIILVALVVVVVVLAVPTLDIHVTIQRCTMLTIIQC